MQEFAQELVQVQELQRRAEAGFSALVAFFGENPSSIPSDSTFWGPIAKFAQIFTATQNEILKKREVSPYLTFWASIDALSFPLGADCSMRSHHRICVGRSVSNFHPLTITCTINLQCIDGVVSALGVGVVNLLHSDLSWCVALFLLLLKCTFHFCCEFYGPP